MQGRDSEISVKMKSTVAKRFVLGQEHFPPDRSLECVPRARFVQLWMPQSCRLGVARLPKGSPLSGHVCELSLPPLLRKAWHYWGKWMELLDFSSFSNTAVHFEVYAWKTPKILWLMHLKAVFIWLTWTKNCTWAKIRWKNSHVEGR